MNNTHTKLPGSERRPLASARAVGPIAPDQTIEITVKLRGAATPAAGAADAAAPAARTYLTREAYEQQYGSSAADIAKVTGFAQQHGLVVVSSRPAQRSVVLSGTAAAMEAAFATKLEDYEHDAGSYRGRTGPLGIPHDVADIIVGVFGLDDRPQATPKFQYRQSPQVAALLAARPPAGQTQAQTTTHLQVQGAADAAAAASGAFTPPQLAKLYNFPADLDGSGQCIGIVELGGGSRPADIKAYFAQLGIPAPTVKSISVDHAKNRPGTADGADGEVMLDIEVAGAIAPKALLAVYYAPNTDRGFLDAITTAVHDKINKPSVISISWGAAEVNWTEQAMTQFEAAFAEAALLGVTICCASGDNGSADGETDGAAHVDFPASAPHALGCGGTKLVVGSGGALTETVWNAGANSATGGGYSGFFAAPDYQSGLAGGNGKRGVPDISGDADPASGYVVRVDGGQYVIGGTSAVAPLWAGLIALCNQRLKQPVGFLHPLLYGALKTQGVTRDITVGDNGAQHAGPGWDACTGWGSPNGQALLAALAGS